MNNIIAKTWVSLCRLGELTKDDRGGVAAEYGVLLAGIVGVVASAAAALGGRIGGLFDSILP